MTAKKISAIVIGIILIIICGIGIYNYRVNNTEYTGKVYSKKELATRIIETYELGVKSSNMNTPLPTTSENITPIKYGGHIRVKTKDSNTFMVTKNKFTGVPSKNTVFVDFLDEHSEDYIFKITSWASINKGLDGTIGVGKAYKDGKIIFD